VLKTVIALAVALFALGAADARADDDANAELMISTGGSVGYFDFDPVGEKVKLYDAQPDHWGMLVELWWGGKLRRWCYNTKGAGASQHCNFKIPDGTRIQFSIAEISSAWFNCKRQGCGKRTHMWAGPSRNGCSFAPKGWPCGYGGGISTGKGADFHGVA
jgi:hypothetical protein